MVGFKLPCDLCAKKVSPNGKLRKTLPAFQYCMFAFFAVLSFNCDWE